MMVVGRVLDPDGQAGARRGVMVVVAGRHRRSADARRRTSGPFTCYGQGTADGSGRFRLELPRTSSARSQRVSLVAAVAPGYGVGWAELDPDADSARGRVTLRPEQVIRGRLFDVQGRPAAGVDDAGRDGRVLRRRRDLASADRADDEIDPATGSGMARPGRSATTRAGSRSAASGRGMDVTVGGRGLHDSPARPSGSGIDAGPSPTGLRASSSRLTPGRTRSRSRSPHNPAERSPDA